MTRRLVVLGILLLGLSLQSLVPAERPDADREGIDQALTWVRTAPRDMTEFDYAMTARVRLLLFWIGKDDVGGGYIRHGFSKEDSREELIQVLFGSDPSKAPRAINRWGAGTEIAWHKASAVEAASSDDVVASAFFGFMKSSKGKSAAEMQTELKKEKEKGEHQFTGILSRVAAGQASSLTVPFQSNTDFNLNQYREAEPLVFEELGTSKRPVRSLPGAGGCSRAGEFLTTVSSLMNSAMEGRKDPLSLCYVYDAQVNTLTLQSAHSLKDFAVKINGAKGGVLIEKTYHDVLEAEFESASQANGKKSNFTIVMGTQGALRGIPLQIRYQPNWWFQVVLNLSNDRAVK